MKAHSHSNKSRKMALTPTTPPLTFFIPLPFPRLVMGSGKGGWFRVGTSFIDNHETNSCRFTWRSKCFQNHQSSSRDRERLPRNCEIAYFTCSNNVLLHDLDRLHGIEPSSLLFDKMLVVLIIPVVWYDVLRREVDSFISRELLSTLRKLLYEVSGCSGLYVHRSR